jgi:hypothetical protein
MLAQYAQRIKDAPREVILSRSLLLSCAMYATAAIPLSMPISHPLLLIPTPLTTPRSMGSRIGVHVTFSFGLPGTVRYQL